MYFTKASLINDKNTIMKQTPTKITNEMLGTTQIDVHSLYIADSWHHLVVGEDQEGYR